MLQFHVADQDIDKAAKALLTALNSSTAQFNPEGLTETQSKALEPIIQEMVSSFASNVALAIAWADNEHNGELQPFMQRILEMQECFSELTSRLGTYTEVKR